MKVLLRALAMLCANFAALFCANCAAAQSNADILRKLSPYPRVAYPTSDTGSFTVGDAYIVVPSGPAFTAVRQAVANLYALIGNQPQMLHEEFIHFPRHAVLIGLFSSSPWFDSVARNTMRGSEAVHGKEGYLIHVTPGQVLLAANDLPGLIYAVARLKQLQKSDVDYALVHIIDSPRFSKRWVFSHHNLRGTNAMNALRTIEDSMYHWHLNGLQQNDFKYNILDQQPAFYFKNADTIKQYSQVRNIEIIPGVASIGYSEGILWHDPNLAEGIPASASYVMESDTGRMIRDPQVTLANGGFESVNGSNFSGWGFYDNENNATQPDKTIFHSGGTSARTIDPNKANSAGNARFNRLIDTKPFTQYYMSAWVRTESIDRGEIRLLAIGNGDSLNRVLTHTQFNVASTTDRTKNNGWVKLGVFFNSLNYDKVYVYCGIWSGRNGTIWWDDFQIEEVGLMNVLRRSGTPLSVRNTSGSKTYIEGSDYYRIQDTILEKKNGFYGYHSPVTLRRIGTSAIRNGDTVVVRYHHPLTLLNDINGYGQVMVCPSEPKLYTVLKDQITRVDSLYHPESYMMQHDEIRVMNWDSACLNRHLTPAQILGENVTRIRRMIDTISPGAEVYTWSDMFDPHHNAVNNYYLVNGDLHGVWDLIPNDLTMINWNNGKRASSLEFFANEGFAQIGAPYYDTRDTRNLYDWYNALRNTQGAKGMMYTTWAADYDFLKPFAHYAWGWSSMSIHRPVDPVNASAVDSVVISAEIRADPYAPYPMAYGEVVVLSPSGDREYSLDPVGSDIHTATVAVTPNSSYFVRVYSGASPVAVEDGPVYPLTAPVNRVADGESGRLQLIVTPNPATSNLTFTAPASGAVRIVDATGRVVYSAEVTQGQRTLDISSLAAGAYTIELSGKELHGAKFVIQR